MELQNADFFEAARICTAPGDLSDCDACPLNTWRLEVQGENPSVPNYNLCIDYLIFKLANLAHEKICRRCKWRDDFTWTCCNGCSKYRGDVVDNEDSCDEWEKKILY